MAVCVLADYVQKALDQSCRKLQKEVSIPGFRKGKTPLGYLRQHYWSNIKQDALRYLAEKAYKEGLKQEALYPAGQAQFDFKPLKEGQDFHFKARFEVHPQPEVKNFENLKIQIKKPEVTEEKVQQVIENLRDSSAKKEEKQGPCQMSDVVCIDISGVVEGGQALPQKNDFLVEVGKNLIFKDIEQALIGMQAGQEKKVETRFPKEQIDLAGKKAAFHIKLKKVFKKIKPEVNDQWVQTLKAENVEQFKKEIKERLKSQAEQDYQEELREKALNELIQKNSFEVPPSILAVQKQRYIDETQKKLKKQGFSEKQIQEWIRKYDKNLEKKSLYHVQAGYLIQSLAEKFNIQRDIQHTQDLLENKMRRKVDSSMVQSFHWHSIQSQVLDIIIQKAQINLA